MGVARLHINIAIIDSFSYQATLKLTMARGGSNAVPKFVEENYRVGDEIAK